MLKRTNFRNPQGRQGFIHMCSLTCRHSFTALDPKMLQQTNFSNPPRLRGSIHIRSSLAWSHFCPPLNSTPTRKPNLIPQRLLGCTPQSSAHRSRHHTNEEIELVQRPGCPHVNEVVAMRDREVLFVAAWPQSDRLHPQSAGAARPAHSRPLRLLSHLGLFLYCNEVNRKFKSRSTRYHCKHSNSSKANLKVKSRPRCHHRRLTLPPPRCP
ncbi:hypothetical protein EDB19DRAFT_295653 [Suillus lakei]|nr:hypothetical protein EDB19DRAFT_295653 [Suillus lakei]